MHDILSIINPPDYGGSEIVFGKKSKVAQLRRNDLIQLHFINFIFINLMQGFFNDMTDDKTAIVLFSDDFRIKDNPALYNAVKNYKNIIPLYIYNENYLGRSLGSASKVFLHNALISFNSLLMKEYGVNLVIKVGNASSIIKEIAIQTPVDAIYFNTSYALANVQVENGINEEFKSLDVKSFKAKLLFHPWEIKPSSGGDFYKVFTPFSKECLRNINLVGDSCPKPEKIKSLHNIEGLKVEDLNLLPNEEGKWFKDLINNWTFSYEEIEENFIEFIDNRLKNYKDDRNIPSKNGNSRISPYLRFGMLSPRICFNITSIHLGIDNQFILELLWREFAYHVIFCNQNIATQELKNEYKGFKWDNSQVLLKKWQKGQTGFDIVDAGMTELWRTGVMHGRMRMIVASFLIKDLLIDWRLGEQWFWNTLVDADPAINPFSWQWVFGSGFDAAPYFRIFNPDLQREKFDPNGSYCKKWLPRDWRPERIVSHDIQRKITLERYKNL